MNDASLSAGPDGRQGQDRNLGQIVELLVPRLGPLDRGPQPLEGGITNRNYRATFAGREYVIRVPGKDTDLLDIDRAAEYEANQAAADVGVAAPVAAFLDEPQAIVTEFIEGRGMEAGELREPEALADVAAALRCVHDSGAALRTSFDSFRIVELYERTARERGAEVPAAFEPALREANRIEAVLGGVEHEPVPCHNDLLAANFIWDGRRVRIVDWEYAGMGDRWFDLANFAVNNELDDRAREGLLAAYFGERPTAPGLGGLFLFMYMSDFREAMWGVVQDAVSELDFDFAGYAAKHFDRMASTAADPSFDAALEEVARATS
jgi:thiamine kinase-like enzyme